MHSFTGPHGTRFFYNFDLSGEVRWFRETGTGNVRVLSRGDLPAADVVAFVDHTRGDVIGILREALEEMVSNCYACDGKGFIDLGDDMDNCQTCRNGREALRRAEPLK
jgi:DnaJ-class molecular chaperone